MSLECRECERDLRGGHDVECSRFRIHADNERAAHCECMYDARRLLAEVRRLRSALAAAPVSGSSGKQPQP